MKQAILITFVLSILVLSLSVSAESSKVKRVIDGDTIQLSNDDKVRLIGIDTPERGDCYYLEAKLKLEQLVLNKEIILEEDITDKDKYQRLLRYIYVEDQFINNILVEEGYAEAYYYKPDLKYYSMFKQSEKQAKRNNLGMWKHCKPSFISLLFSLFN